MPAPAASKSSARAGDLRLRLVIRRRWRPPPPNAPALRPRSFPACLEAQIQIRKLLGYMAAGAATATLRWVLQLHRDVPRAARFYAEGLDFSVNVCTLRWAELQSGPLKLALMHTNDSNLGSQKVYSSMLSFTVADINSTVSRLMALGAELDGPIKYEIHGKVAALRCIDGHMLGLYESA